MRKSISIRAGKTAAGSDLDRQVERSHSDNDEVEEEEEEVVEKGEWGQKWVKCVTASHILGRKQLREEGCMLHDLGKRIKLDLSNAKRPRCALGGEETNLRASIRDEEVKAAESFDADEKELSKAAAIKSAKDSKEYTRDEVSRHVSHRLLDHHQKRRLGRLQVSFKSPGREDIIFEFAGSDATERLSTVGILHLRGRLPDPSSSALCVP